MSKISYSQPCESGKFGKKKLKQLSLRNLLELLLYNLLLRRSQVAGSVVVVLQEMTTVKSNAWLARDLNLDVKMRLPS